MTQRLSADGATWLPIADLVPWDRNPRKNDGEPVARVADSIRAFGFVAPIVVWRGGGRMVAGHTRLKALKSLLAADPSFVPPGAPGPGVARVVFHEFESEAKADLYALADNKLGELAAWDDEGVGEILSRFNDDEVALAGFDDEFEPPPPPDEDDVPEPPKVAVTQAGDLYQLGDHRLLCGDCRDAEGIARLLAGATADALITDPPYGISIVGRAGTAGNFPGTSAPRLKARPIHGDDSPFTPDHLLGLARHAILWGGNYFANRLPVGGKWLIWDKKEGAFQGSDLGDCEMAWTSLSGTSRLFHHTWQGMYRKGEGERAPRVHPTQKPVDLMRWCIEQAGSPALVLDTYAGSGSTLMASERLGLGCRAVEIDPIYCDVIVERWQSLTGKKAVRL